MRKLLVPVALFMSCAPNTRVDAFELGSACDVGATLDSCPDMVVQPDQPGGFMLAPRAQAIVLDAPVTDLRIRTADDLVSRVYAEFAIEWCPLIEARLLQDLGRENRRELLIAHWRGATLDIAFDYSADRPVCSVVVAQRD
jgi:hypothetical protein